MVSRRGVRNKDANGSWWLTSLSPNTMKPIGLEGDQKILRVVCIVQCSYLQRSENFRLGA